MCNQETISPFPCVDFSVLIKRRWGNLWSGLLPSCLWTDVSRTEHFVTLLLALIRSDGSQGSLTLACSSLRAMAFCASTEGQAGMGTIQYSFTCLLSARPWVKVCGYGEKKDTLPLLKQWFSKYDPTGITWELVINAKLQAPPPNLLNSELGGGDPAVCFHQLPGDSETGCLKTIRIL